MIRVPEVRAERKNTAQSSSSPLSPPALAPHPSSEVTPIPTGDEPPRDTSMSLVWARAGHDIDRQRIGQHIDRQRDEEHYDVVLRDRRRPRRRA